MIELMLIRICFYREKV